MLQSAGGQVELYVCTSASAVNPTLPPEQRNPFLTVGGVGEAEVMDWKLTDSVVPGSQRQCFPK